MPPITVLLTLTIMILGSNPQLPTKQPITLTIIQLFTILIIIIILILILILMNTILILMNIILITIIVITIILITIIVMNTIVKSIIKAISPALSVLTEPIHMLRMTLTLLT